MQPINLIVSCTSRKRATAPQALRARTLKAKSLSKRLDEWVSRRANHVVEQHPAADVYAGDHWHVARAIPRVAADGGFDVRLWVCSAGYGLIRASDRIKPYSITFSPRHPDSVVPVGMRDDVGSATPGWWSGLSKHAVTDGPRNIASLASREPDVPIVIVASAPYVRAMMHDLAAAAAVLGSRDLLSILSVGADATREPELTAYLLSVDVRFETLVGGTRAALNARIARLVFQHLGVGEMPSRPHLEATLQKLSSSLAPLRRFDRQKLSDEEVRQFIEEERRIDPSASKTRLLRGLRGRGSACEQARFSEIYSQTTEGGDDAS